MTVRIDPEAVAVILRDCAEKYIVPRFRALEDHHIKSKSSPRDLVTVADIETENALDQILTREFPGSTVIGEEGVSSGATQIDILKNTDGMIWVVDPVDGTSNFVHGRDEFCTMLACVVNGHTRHSWIYDIPKNRIMVAEKGGGAAIDGRPCVLAPVKALKECRGHAGRGYFPKPLRPLLDEFKGEVKSLHSLGCAGHEYLNMLTGQVDFSLYTRIRPWDHLAGTLAVREAGGLVQKWNGSSYESSDHNEGIVISSHAALMDSLNDRIVTPLLDALAAA